MRNAKKITKGTTVVWATTTNRHLRTLVRITSETRRGVRKQFCWFARADVAESILNGSITADDAYLYGNVIKLQTRFLHEFVANGLVYVA